MNHILVDFENVHVIPSFSSETNLMIFIGPDQTKIPLSLAQQVQVLGGHCQYIKLPRPGKNSLDFCLTSYLGILIERDQGGNFTIISRDKGYDPMIEHWANKGVTIKRVVP